MGIFDSILLKGKKFTKEEIKILDKNFNSISAHTKKKFKFSSREIKGIYGSEFQVNYHRIIYTHENIDTDMSDPKWQVNIQCDRYYLYNERDYEGFKNFFENFWGDKDAPRIKVPEIKDFPSPVLLVGYRFHGFAVELSYNFKSKIDRILEDPRLSKKCTEKINSLTIKYLKGLD